ADPVLYGDGGGLLDLDLALKMTDILVRTMCARGKVVRPLRLRDADGYLNSRTAGTRPPRAFRPGVDVALGDVRVSLASRRGRGEFEKDLTYLSFVESNCGGGGMRHVGGIVLSVRPSSASVRQKACVQSSYHSRLESSGVRSPVESPPT